ncbi:MAG: hypothetical protein B5M56_00290 [Desulfococcus sp. 4484_241]|nr:MAG: hypothetical protein B5M56_00290 [Desulfococcus sp. 4484_241]
MGDVRKPSEKAVKTHNANAEIVKKLYKRAVVTAAAGACVVLLLLALVLTPLHIGVSKTRKEIFDFRNAHKKQETLYPAYLELLAANADLASMLNEMQNNAGRSFISSPEIGRLPEEFRSAMSSAGLALKTCVPDIDSVTKGERAFNLKIGFTGDFRRIPMFLSRLEAEKKVVRINKFKAVYDNGKYYEMDLWVNMDT